MLSQLPLLWKYPSYRFIIIIILIKILSPLFAVSIIGISSQFFHSLTPLKLLLDTMRSRLAELSSLPHHAFAENHQTFAGEMQETLPEEETYPRIFTFPRPHPPRPKPYPSQRAQQLLARRRQRFYHTYRTKQASAEEKQGEEKGKAGEPCHLADIRLDITVLKSISLTLVIQQNNTMHRYPLPTPSNARRLQLVSYIGEHQPVAREKILEDIFGHTLSDEEATTEKLSEQFDSHKKLLRKDLQKALKQANADLGLSLSQQEIFSHQHKQYALTSLCHITDIEQLTHLYERMQTAATEEEKRQAGEALIKSYPGDFFEEMVSLYPEEFEPLYSSWIRAPYTKYRDWYLQALWLLAEHAQHQGEQALKEATSEAASEHLQQAASLYAQYAQKAVENRLDLKISFKGKEVGERVAASERAMRYAIRLWAQLNDHYHIDTTWATYYKHLRRLSSQAWSPSEKTQQVLHTARKQSSTGYESFDFVP